MAYRKVKQKARRAYSRGKSLFGGDMFKNPLIVGLITGAVKNALAGKKIIDIESIKQRISKVDGSNPLLFLGIGIAMRNPALTAIGAYALIDPPDDAEKKEGYIRYSNIGEIQKTEKKRCVY